MFGFVRQHAKKAGLSAAVLLALPLTAQYEGLRTRSYLDPVGIPTICYGETQDVEMGMVKSKEECDKMLTMRLGYFSAEVDALVEPDMSPQTHAAFTSFAYNVGVGAFKKSSVLRLYNDNQPIAACNFLDRYVYAGGKKLTGLVKRREEEKKLCLSGL